MSLVQDESAPASGRAVTTARARGTIVEAIVVRAGGRYGVAAVATGLVLFLTGLLIASVIDFHREYLKSRQIYLGVIAVIWVMWWIAWATRRLRVVMENVQPIFLVSADRFRAEVERFEAWAFNWRLQIAVALILWGFSCFDIYNRSRTGRLFAFEQPEWTGDPHLLTKNLILAIFNLANVTLLVTSAIGIVCFVFFVANLRRLPLVPYMALARLKLRSLTDFAVTIGLAWSVGISLVVLLFRVEFHPAQVANVLVYTALGLGILVLPELSIHSALEHQRHEVLNEAIRRMRTPIASVHDPDWRTLADSRDDPAGGNFYRVVQDAIDSPTWTYDIANVSSVLGTWLLPLVPLAVNSLVR